MQLIEGLYPTESQLDKSARDALRYGVVVCELDGVDRHLWHLVMRHTRGPPGSSYHVHQTKTTIKISYEAQNLFLELDNLREAAKFNRPKARVDGDS